MAKARIYNMEIAVGINGKGLFSKSKQIANSIKNIGKQAKVDVGTGSATKSLKELDKAIADTEKQIEKLVKKQKSIEKNNVDTKEFKDLQKEAAATERQIDDLKTTLSTIKDPGAASRTAATIKELELHLRNLKDRMDEIRQNGATGKETNEWYEVADAIDRAEVQLAEYKAQRNAIAAGSGPAKDLPASKKLTNTLRSLGSRALIAGKSLAGMTGRTIVGGFQRVTGAAMNFSKRIVQTTFNLKKMKKTAMAVTGIKGFAKYGVIGVAVYSAVRMVKQGFENLAQYSPAVNNSISSIMTALLQLKNSLATAFAPILSVVAPILVRFINLLSRAATAVAHFFSALTGKKTVVVAKKAVVDYAAGLNSASKNADKATKAQKKLNRTLMGFDQINKLESNKDSGSKAGSGSGGGGSYTGPSPAQMFETQEVSKGAASLAEKVRKAFKSGDWSKVGATVADKITGIFKKLDAKKLGAGVTKALTSIPTFIYGFFERINWQKAGQTMINGLIKFFKSIKWGKVFSSWARAAGAIVGALAGLAVGIFKALKAAINSATKKAKGYFKKKIKEAGGNIPLGIFNGIKDGIKGIGKWIKKNIFDPFIKGFKNAFGIKSPSKEMEDPGKQIILGVLEGIKNNVEDLFEWFADLPGKLLDKVEDLNIPVDFVANKVGKVWDYVTEKVSNVVSYTAEKAGSVWASLTTKLSGVASYVAEKAGKVWDTLTTKLSGVASYVAEKAGKIWDSITNMAGKTLNYYADRAGKTWDKIKDMAGKTLNYSADRVGKTWETIKDMAGKTLNYSADRVGKTWDKIKNMKGKTLKYTAKLTGKAWKFLTKIGGKAIKFVTGGKAEGGIYKGSRWRPVQTAATGGAFSQGQMFIAREAGPELVGTIGGSTAVMNNDQIVRSVAAGVYKAVVSAMSQISGDKSTTVVLQGDAAKFFKVIRDEAKNYTMATGQSAF